MNYNQMGLANFISAYGDRCQLPPHSKSNGHLMSWFAFMNHLKRGMMLSQNPDPQNQLCWLRDLFAKTIPNITLSSSTTLQSYVCLVCKLNRRFPFTLMLFWTDVVPDKCTPSVLCVLLRIL
jgi:hypothetical protein